MDFQLEWIKILNFMISKILIEKMILILNIGMNLKTYGFRFGPGTTIHSLKPQNNVFYLNLIIWGDEFGKS